MIYLGHKEIRESAAEPDIPDKDLEFSGLMRDFDEHGSACMLTKLHDGELTVERVEWNHIFHSGD